MLEIVLVIILLLASIAIIYMAYSHVQSSRSASPQGCSKINKQEYVKENRRLFGVSNKGTSMDKRKIYSVDASKLGF